MVFRPGFKSPDHFEKMPAETGTIWTKILTERN